MPAAFDLRIILLSALKEQLATSRQEMEEARLQEVLLMEYRKRTMVVGIHQGVDVALAAM